MSQPDASRPGGSGKKSSASQRWNFLREAVESKGIPDPRKNPASKRQFEVYSDLIEMKTDDTNIHVLIKLSKQSSSQKSSSSEKDLEQQVKEIKSRDLSFVSYSLLLSQKYNTPNIFLPKDSDETGRICVWPSEQILAYWMLRNRFLFKGKRVLELGGGFHCLAGLALAKFTKAERVVLTDGDKVNVARVTDSIRLNNIPADGCHARTLSWGQLNWPIDLQNFFDTVIAADVVYETSISKLLLETVAYVLKPKGEFILFNPTRNGVLDDFVNTARQKPSVFPDVNVSEHYDSTVSDILQRVGAENSAFNKEWHYPVKVILKKGPTQNTEFPFGFNF